jgi:hypothetical protein
VTGSSKRKGDRAEIEGAALLTRLVGRPVRRILGAGRDDDVGDLEGVPRWVVQVAWWPSDTLRAVRRKPVDAETQAENSGLPHSVAMVRLVGGEFRMVMTPEAWARIVVENENLRRIQREVG